jgi:asparagine synthase (glutamine-hydrolysing)
LGTDHTELHVTAREAMEVVPNLPVVYDEPFGDSSTIPTVLVAQLAHRQVKVSLSGDGGDELFGGYARYRRMNHIWSVARRIPYSARKALSCGVGAIARQSRTSLLGEKASRLARYLAATSAADCYQAQILQRDDAYDLVLGSKGLSSANTGVSPALSSANLYDTMMYADTMTYLPDDILVKVDRAAMAVSLETRVPMLDHRLVEFAWRLPLHMKVRNGEGKWLLKQVLRKYLPVAMLDRPKMGFGAPVGDWLKGPLRDWAESLLSLDQLTSQGLLNPQQVREQWSRHLDGVRAGGDSLWQLIAFQAWLSHSPRFGTQGSRAS